MPDTSLPPRPDTVAIVNGAPATLPFAPEEYARRLEGLRGIMASAGTDAVVLTSMHNIAYYSGFLYCAFGRPYAMVVTSTAATVVAALIDHGQPGRRSACATLTYTDWRRDNFWRAVAQAAAPNGARPRRVGVEGDHLSLAQAEKLAEFLGAPEAADIAPATMSQRMLKSPAEIALIREGARIADLGGWAIRAAIAEGAREIDIAQAGRDKMESAIADAFPEAEYRDTWVWFQSGLNTDGAHNPLTARRLQQGDVLSMNCFPMISGYYTALERTLFLGEPKAASRRVWDANVAAHELGLSLIRPGVRCSDICAGVNAFLADEGLLEYRTFGYGHSFGLLSHYYGREGGLELREDVDTVLQPGHVVSMEPMLTIPDGQPGAGGYREHDILVVGEDGAENITGYPYGPAHNIVGT
ncbi:MAG: aminopeptidase P family protein [Pseudomonadota bacterium]